MDIDHSWWYGKKNVCYKLLNVVGSSLGIGLIDDTMTSLDAQFGSKKGTIYL